MTKNKELVYDIIQLACDVPKNAITNMARTPGGETNVSYFATVAGKEYVVRLPGKGTEVLINRRAEKENLTFGTKLGINPAFVYFDETTGIKISHAIPAATALTKETAKYPHILLDIIELFQHLHEADDVMTQRFDLFQMIDHYEQLAYVENTLQPKKLASLRAEIASLKNVYQSYDIQAAPCHMDAVSINILRDEADRLYLIDWEYSGMFDPLWDVATLFLSLELTEEEELFFLTTYFRCEPNAEALQRLHVLKIFLDYYWSLWYMYKETQGDNFGNKGTARINRAAANLASYQVLYADNIVV